MQPKYRITNLEIRCIQPLDLLSIFYIYTQRIWFFSLSCNLVPLNSLKTFLQRSSFWPIFKVFKIHVETSLFAFADVDGFSYHVIWKQMWAHVPVVLLLGRFWDQENRAPYTYPYHILCISSSLLADFATEGKWYARSWCRKPLFYVNYVSISLCMKKSIKNVMLLQKQG